MEETDKSNFISTVEDHNNNKRDLEFIEHITTNANEIQLQVLTEILTHNAHVEYLQKHGLEGRTDQETFKKLIPVVTYEDLLPEIQRIVDGDTSPLLCSNPITEFIRSTGTSSGKGKLIPMTEDEFNRRLQSMRLSKSIISQFITNVEDGGKLLFIALIRPESYTPGATNLPIGTALTSYLRKLGTFGSTTQVPTCPIEISLCPDNFQSLYAQLLCALAQRETVFWAGAVFALGFIHAIKFILKHYNSLSNDIRSGTPDPTILTDQTLRKIVTNILSGVGPNPTLAEFIETECGKEEALKGIVKRLWPNIKFIDTIVTGTMSQYVTTLDYFSDGIPLVSRSYASSEGHFGVNLNPFCKPSEVAYTLLPHMGYFEFLPVRESNDGVGVEMSKQLVQLVDVKLGHEYELVVTTYAGLYRYRVGDILRVAGFKNNAPQFNFIRRANVILSIDQDKTDEVELLNAVNKALTYLHSHNYSIIEYTSTADTSTIPGHYVLFMEISSQHNSGSTTTSENDIVSGSVMEECCLLIEESLNSSYLENRVRDGSIGALEIRVVEGGTFDELMDYVIKGGGSISQYKTPKCVKNEEILEMLNSRVLSKHFSPKCPKWSPGQ